MDTTTRTPDGVEAPAEHIAKLDWSLHLQPAGALLVERNSLAYFRLSGRAAELALAVVRTGSFEGAARVQSARYGRPLSEVQAALRRELAEHPLTAKWSEGILGSALPVTGSADAYIPLLCSLQLTNRCNLLCSHCYAESGSAFSEELSLEQWLDVLRRLAAAGVAAITLTGGEPTTAHGFTEILAAAALLFPNVDVFTNGWKTSPRIIDLAAAFPNIRFQVSIDGSRKHHDELRRRQGSYDEALSSAHRLADAGIPVVISMSVTPTNHTDVLELLHAAQAAGVSDFRAGMVKSTGRATESESALTPGQREMVRRQLEQGAAGSDAMNVLVWPDEQEESLGPGGGSWEFCTPAYLNWHVRPDGAVTPCQFETASFGNILEASLQALGAEARLEDCRAIARTCECLPHVDLPAQRDSPFAVR